MDKQREEKGEISMNACVVKPQIPFVAKKVLDRTPASDSNRKMVEFMDSHNFSFNVDINKKEINCKITRK